MIFGHKNNYHWFSTNLEIKDLAEIAVSFHQEHYLYVTSFDSGELSISNEEKEIGWFSNGKISGIFLNSEAIHIPNEQFDEWYFSNNEISFPPEFEIFVNYSDFSLSEKIISSEITNIFWRQIEELQPQTYIANGNNVVVVSKSVELIHQLKRKA